MKARTTKAIRNEVRTAFIVASAWAGLTAWTWQRPPVEGVVVVEQAGVAVAASGVLVTLMGPDGAALGLTVTDGTGRFRLAQGAGSRLRVEAIGRAVVEAPVPAEGDVRIVLPATRIALPTTGPSACSVNPPADEPAAILWGEARKALRIEAWARANHIFSYDVFQYDRRLSERERIDSERGRRISDVAEGPARTLPPSELRTAGYARSTPRGDILYAPDAEALLSDGFAESHCFGVGPTDRGRVGLTFEPTVTTGRVDIGGVIWIDERTAELDAIEFRYTGLGAPSTGGPGGVVEFRRLGDGLWSMAKWAVRTPAPRTAPELFREEGVEVIRVVRLDGTSHVIKPRAHLLGVVRDRTGTTLAGANVQLAGTSYAAMTNADGRFYIPELPAGRFRVTVANPPGGAEAWIGQDVFLTASQSTQVDVNLGAERAVASKASTRALTAEDSVLFFLESAGLARSVRVDSLITSALRSAESGRLVGRIYDRSSGKGISGAIIGLSGINHNAISASDGRFSLGDVRTGTYVLETEMLGYATRRDSVNVPPGLVIDAAVALTTRPIDLEPITVTVLSRWLDSNGFFERRRGGLDGHFFTRAEIDRKAPAEFTDLLKDLPGVFIMTEEIGKQMVRFRRTTTIARSAEESRGCQPGVYYDGIPLNIGFDLLHNIPVPFIDGVEVYVGAATPIDYKNPCGVILIWTRRPR